MHELNLAIDRFQWLHFYRRMPWRHCDPLNSRSRRQQFHPRICNLECNRFHRSLRIKISHPFSMKWITAAPFFMTLSCSIISLVPCFLSPQIQHLIIMNMWIWIDLEFENEIYLLQRCWNLHQWVTAVAKQHHYFVKIDVECPVASMGLLDKAELEHQACWCLGSVFSKRQKIYKKHSPSSLFFSWDPSVRMLLKRKT